MSLHAEIVLIVEHKWRDLPSLAALSTWLEAGYALPTRLISYTQWATSLVTNRSRLVCISSMYGSRNRQIIKLAHEVGARVVGIMAEGRPNNMDGMAQLVGDKSNAAGVDLWFTWSETVRDYMLEREVITPEKLVVAGSPRFDIYRSPLSDLIVSREDFAHKYQLNPRKPIISWATNFTHASLAIQQAGLTQEWANRDLIEYSSYTEPTKLAHLDWEVRDQTAHVIQQLLFARPDLQLVVKPHPSEEPDFYTSFVKRCQQSFGNRVALVNSEYIWDVLNAVDIHIHRMSTTGVEAWLLDKPSINLCLRDYYPWSASLPGSASEAALGDDLVRDTETLIDRVDYYLSGGKPTAVQYKARKQYIERWLYVVDGQRCAAHAKVIGEFLTEIGDTNRSLDQTLPKDYAGHQIESQVVGKRLSSRKQADRNSSLQDINKWRQAMLQVLSQKIASTVQHF